MKSAEIKVKNRNFRIHFTVEEDRMAGRNGCTLDEVDAYLDDVIAEV